MNSKLTVGRRWLRGLAAWLAAVAVWFPDAKGEDIDPAREAQVERAQKALDALYIENMLSCGDPTAPPLREVAGGVMVTVPERIEVLPGGQLWVVEREVGPVEWSEIRLVVPEEVAVWTVTPGGELLPGFPVEDQIRIDGCTWPAALVYAEAGYEIQVVMSRIACGRPQNAENWSGWSAHTKQREMRVCVYARCDYFKPPRRVKRTAPKAQPWPWPPPPDVLLGPLPDEADVSLTPTFHWRAGGGTTTSRDLYMYDGDRVNAPNAFYSAIGVEGLSHTMPPGILRPGRMYYWFTTAINEFNFTWAEGRNFTTCSGGGGRDMSDVTTVLTNLGKSVGAAPAGVFTGDADGNGFVDVADLRTVLMEFGLGCR